MTVMEFDEGDSLVSTRPEGLWEEMVWWEEFIVPKGGWEKHKEKGPYLVKSDWALKRKVWSACRLPPEPAAQKFPPSRLHL